MKRIEGFEELKKETTETSGTGSIQLPVGPQVCKIINVIDVPEREYLKVEFDVVEGEYTGFMGDAAGRIGDWPSQGRTYRSYKSSAYQYFTAFIIAIEKSNSGFAWQWNEKDLIGKKFVANFGEEEYVYEGELRTSIRAREIRSIVSLREGKIKIPEKKVLTDAQKKELNTTDVTEAVDMTLPF